MTVQLRIYTINRGHLDDFVGAWRSGVLPLRNRLGYTVEHACAIKETNQFVWMVRLADTEDWTAREAAYYASPERAALSPDPAQWIARAEQYFVQPIVSAPGAGG